MCFGFVNIVAGEGGGRGNIDRQRLLGGAHSLWVCVDDAGSIDSDGDSDGGGRKRGTNKGVCARRARKELTVRFDRWETRPARLGRWTVVPRWPKQNPLAYLSNDQRATYALCFRFPRRSYYFLRISILPPILPLSPHCPPASWPFLYCRATGSELSAAYTSSAPRLALVRYSRLLKFLTSQRMYSTATTVTSSTYGPYSVSHTLPSSACFHALCNGWHTL